MSGTRCAALHAKTGSARKVHARTAHNGGECGFSGRSEAEEEASRPCAREGGATLEREGQDYSLDAIFFRSREVERSRSVRGALEEHETTVGNLGDGERLVAKNGFLAVVGDLGARAELHLFIVGE